MPKNSRFYNLLVKQREALEIVHNNGIALVCIIAADQKSVYRMDVSVDAELLRLSAEFKRADDELVKLIAAEEARSYC